MSFNLTLVAPSVAICVSDRRLTRDEDILSERSTKLTTFACPDAHGFITYNGIGTDMQGATPSDWLCDMPQLGTLPLDALLEAIKTDTDRRLADERAKGRPDTRHSFVIGGYQNLVPFVALISNYERFDSDVTLPSAEPEMGVTTLRMTIPTKSKHPCALVSTGAYPRQKAKARDRIVGKLKAGAKPEAIRAKMIKVVRDVAYQSGRKGTVGTSVLSAMTGPFGGVEVSGHVPGGTTLLESPNSISAQMMVKDIYIDVSGDREFRSRYDPKTGTARIDEARCPNCGAPVPEGYRKCGVCDARL